MDQTLKLSMISTSLLFTIGRQ